MSENTPRTTTAQLRIALALAGSYGHEWPSAFDSPREPRPEWLPEGWEPLTVHSLDGLPCAEAGDVIAARAREQCYPGLPAGILAPTFDAEGDIHHTTGSGRLRWSIDAAGRVTINVWRPEEVHALLVILDERGEVSRLDVTDDCRIRHIEAAALAMRVVLGVHAPDRDVHALVDICLAPVRRSIALRDYGDLLDRVRQLVVDAEGIELTATELEDEALDCQLPHTWGISALRAWAEQVLP